jgi:hypothetical protein
MSPHAAQLIWTWVGVILTLCIFSFLYKENPFYRFAEHLMVGVMNAYSLAFLYYLVILPVLIKPLGQAFHIAFTTGPSASLFLPSSGPSFFLFVPGLIGCMYFLRFVPKYAWTVRFPIGIFMGYYTGVAIPAAFEGSVFPQMKGTVVTRASFGDLAGGIWAVLVLIGVLTTLAYFFFSKEQKGILKWSAKSGIIFIMVGFGASFGFTVMARVSLAIGRFYFLLRDWLGILT